VSARKPKTDTIHAAAIARAEEEIRILKEENRVLRERAERAERAARALRAEELARARQPAPSAPRSGLRLQ
jgi:hypothetical protein